MVTATPEKPKAPMPAAEVTDLTAQALAQAITSFKKKGFFEWAVDVTIAVLNAVIAHVFILIGGLAARLARIVIQVKDQGDPAYNALAEAAVGDLFGVQVSIGGTGAASATPGRGQAVKSIGDAVLKAMFEKAQASSEGGSKPTDEGAMSFLNMMVRMSFEGWMGGWLVEMIGGGQLETFGELDDKLSAALGLGRLSRRVLGPPIDLFITTPYTWLLNKTYRPNLLGTAEGIRQFLRGRWTREQLFEECARGGLKDSDIELLLATHQKFLNDADVLLLIERGAWTKEEGIQHLRDSGYSKELAETTLLLEENRKVDAYRRRAADSACDAFAAGNIEEAQLKATLDTLFLPEWENFWLRKCAAGRRVFSARHLGLSDMEAAVRRGIRSIVDYRELCLKMGYTTADAQTLELLLMAEVTDATTAAAAKVKLAEGREAAALAKVKEQQAARDAAAAEMATRGVSLGQEEALVRAGLRTVDDYRAFLTAQKYTPEAVDALADLLDYQLDQARAEAERREELRKEAGVKKLNLPQLEEAVKRGLFSVDEYRSRLAELGFVEADRDLLARMLQVELDQAAAAAAQRADAQAALAARGLDLGQVEAMTRRGLWTMAQYRAWLTAAGYDTEAVGALAALLKSLIDADDEARTLRVKAAAALKKRKISLDELDRAVRAGVRTMADYRAALSDAGYSSNDIDTLAALLQFYVDADADALARRKLAEEKLKVKQISLADVERAVKLGVLTISQYTAFLKRQGFSVEDQDTLRLILLAEVSAIRTAEEAKRKDAAALQKRGLSLADWERAVRQGVRTMPEYQAFLAAQGFGTADVQTLTALLQLQLEQDRAAAEKRQQVDVVLAPKGLSLGQEEAAVKAGLKSLPEYEAFLRAQGYAAEDVAVLAALLEFRMLPVSGALLQ